MLDKETELSIIEYMKEIAGGNSMKLINVYLNNQLCLIASIEWLEHIFTWSRSSVYQYTIKIVDEVRG